MLSLRGRRWRAGFLAGVLTLALLGASSGSALLLGPPATSVAVVVRADSVAHAAAALAASGGTVERLLPLVDGVAGQVPEAAATTLADRSGVAVTVDGPLSFASVEGAPVGVDHVQLAAVNPGEGWSPAAGAGVGVALLDTGVAAHPDLAGRVVVGPDLSGDGDGLDRYGHGTFMAGLIAGHGAGGTSGAPRYGVAPGAHIVSVKLAGHDGVTSLAKVLDAIGWVVEHQDEYGIRVLNLSIGVPTTVAPQADPLTAAVEAAWAAGVTVVAAAGNEGADGVTSPGRSPWVITVGATDTQGTATTADDTVPAWSGHGRVTSTRKPELLAPGVGAVSLRVPGSLIDAAYPEARVDEAYFRGSGTSMSTAVVAGAVAALAETRPWATPDDLKGALVTAGAPIDGTAARAIDLAAADAAEPNPGWRQRHQIVAHAPDGARVHAMPWSRPAAPPAEVTWSRARWASDGAGGGGWSRARWADTEVARARWADTEVARARWAENGLARARWAETGLARARWAEENLARARWADVHVTRARWAEQDWARARWAVREGPELWVRARWVAAIWTERGEP